MSPKPAQPARAKPAGPAGAGQADPLQRLPHREPFVFISEVTTLTPGERAEGVWRVTGKEPFFAGHFPGRPVVPGALLGEALAQLSGLVGFSGGDPKAAAREARGARAGEGPGRPDEPALLSQVNLKFLRPVVPPAEIRLSAEWARSMGALSLFNVEARAGRHVVAHGSLTLAAPEESQQRW